MNRALSARGLRALCVLALASSQLGACSSSNLMEEDGSDSAGRSNAGSGPSASGQAGSSGRAGSPNDEGGAAGEAGAAGSDAGGSTSGTAGAGTSGGGATNGGTSGGGGKGGASGGGGKGGGGAGGSLAGGGSTNGGAAGAGAGGSLGGAGSGGGATCGNGTLDEGEVCDSKFSVENCGGTCKAITSAACFACENTDATCKEFVSCDAVTGAAAAGSPAAGVARKYLCNEVLDCIRTSNCAGPEDSEIAKCYCGTASTDDCQAGQGNGPCKAQLDRGLETTSFPTIVQRIGSKTYGGGMAMSRFDCDQSFCPVECF